MDPINIDQKVVNKAGSQPDDGMLRIFPPKDGAFAGNLAIASRAFALGDFKSAREQAKTVMRGPATTEEREFAKQILNRTNFDPVAIWVGLGCFVILLLVALMTWQ